MVLNQIERLKTQNRFYPLYLYCERFLQKVSHYRDLALVLEVIIQISSMAEGNVLVCVLKCFLQTLFHSPSHVSLHLAEPWINPKGIQPVCQHFFYIYRTRNCVGLSIKSQELTTIFLTVRVYYSLVLK